MVVSGGSIFTVDVDMAIEGFLMGAKVWYFFCRHKFSGHSLEFEKVEKKNNFYAHKKVPNSIIPITTTITYPIFWRFEAAFRIIIIIIIIIIVIIKTSKEGALESIFLVNR